MMSRRRASRSAPTGAPGRARLGLRWTRLIQIDIALARGLVRVLFGSLEEFVELLLEYLAVRLLGFKLLLEELLAACAFAFQLGDLGRQVFNGRRLYRHRMRDHRARLGVDLENRLAAWTDRKSGVG